MAEELANKMNKEQREIYDEIREFLVNPKKGGSKIFFVEGPGGSGKTFLYRAINHLAMSLDKKVVNMAPSGIAATLLRNGRTVHNVFGLSVPLEKDSQSNLEAKDTAWKILKESSVIICDEAPMMLRYGFEIGDRKCREIMENDEIFGGKIVLFGGDFQQVLPIKANADRSEIVNLSVKNSYIWKHCKVRKLVKNMRANPEEVQFVGDLLEIGCGSANDENDRYLLPDHCICDGDLPEEIFGDIIKNKKYGDLANRAILSPYNNEVSEINEKVLTMMNEEERIYLSIDNCGDDEMATTEMLNAANPAGLPPHVLRLKKNCILILLRNLNVKDGLVNGTRLQVLSMENNVLRCVILTGDRAGQEVLIPRITLKEEGKAGKSRFEFTLKRHQFPVRLAFSMTINKSQGQTLDMVGIDLQREVFGHGQLYVAISRVRAWRNVRVKLSKEHADKKVKNVVFKEILT